MHHARRPKPLNDVRPQKGPPEHEYTWNGDYCIHCGMSYSAIQASSRPHCFPPEVIEAGRKMARLRRTGVM